MAAIVEFTGFDRNAVELTPRQIYAEQLRQKLLAEGTLPKVSYDDEGEVSSYNVSEITGKPVNTYFTSAATIMHDQQAGDAIQTPNGHVIASEEQLVSPDLSPKTAKEKTILTIAAVGLAVILLYNFFK